MAEIIIPFVDLKQRFVDEKEELMSTIEKVLSSGNLVLTAELENFEKNVSEYTGAKYCLGLNSGTDALMMALMCAGIKKGDEVITTPISFVATVGAIAHVGAKPVFVDTGTDMNIDEEKIEAAITSNTKAIVPVHWAGRVANMPRILEIAKQNNLTVIEDSAQAMGSFYNNQHGGTFGLAGVISFHPLKNLNALGDGGMLITNSLEVYDRVKRYRNHGLEGRDNCVEYGVNSRLDILHSEVLKYRLKKINDIVKKRQRNIDIYRKLIKDPQVNIPIDSVHQKTSYVMFLVLCESRDELKEFLLNKGIETLIYYSTPLHLHKAAAKYNYKKGNFPISEKQAEQVLAFPHHQYLSINQIEYVAQSVNEFYNQ